jgi:MFS family permease
LKHVWILTAVVAFFGVAAGIMLNATPQAALSLGFSSDDIGQVGVGIPIGYTVSCLLFWRSSGRLPGKYVLLCGIAGSLAAMVLMGLGRTVAVCTAAQVAFGLSGGAFWPFASAWLLDFQDEGLSKTRLLRHYNVAWTTGTSLGMFAAGMLCERGLIQGALFAGAGVMAYVFAAACCARSKARASRSQTANADDSDAPHARRVPLPLLVAAVSVNMVALGTRAMIQSNYPELNKALSFGADRMGMLTALTILTQVAAFSFGAIYEPWLGLRRLYGFIAVALLAINLAFAYSSSLALLVPAVILHGFVLAVAFQTGIFAATGFFSVARTGTTFHEAMVGVAGVAVLLAGHLVGYLKSTGLDPFAALRAPFLLMAGVIAAVLVLQLVLVSSRNRQRMLVSRADSGAAQNANVPQ